MFFSILLWCLIFILPVGISMYLSMSMSMELSEGKQMIWIYLAKLMLFCNQFGWSYLDNKFGIKTKSLQDLWQRFTIPNSTPSTSTISPLKDSNHSGFKLQSQSFSILRLCYLMWWGIQFTFQPLWTSWFFSSILCMKREGAFLFYSSQGVTSLQLKV